MPKPTPIIECGSCSQFHRLDFHGDCRDDDNRFSSLGDAATRLNQPVIEAFEEEEDEVVYSGVVVMPGDIDN